MNNLNFKNLRAAALFSITFLSVGCSQSANSDEVRGPAIWNIDLIDDKVERIAAGERFDFYDTLLASADSLLGVEQNPSVMLKPHAPASGDMHDYQSLARYWWPNPDSEDGLPYVRRDGLSNPELELYDRHQLGDMAESVGTLALVYYISSDQRYADRALSRLRTWFVDEQTRMNPNFNYAQIHKGHHNDEGTQFGLLDGYSFVEMLDALSLMELRGALPSDVKSALHGWFAELSRWMLTSKNGIAEGNGTNNHAVAYDAQVLRYAMYGGADSIALAVIDAFPERRLAAQIAEDGRMPEELARTTAFGYTRYNLEHMIDICNMARGYDVDLYSASNRAIERAIDWMIPYSKDEESFPYQQIYGWQKTRESFARLLYRASEYGKADEYREYYRTYRAEKESPMFEFLYM